VCVDLLDGLRHGSCKYVGNQVIRHLTETC
jgi:hypothetical protein